MIDLLKQKLLMSIYHIILMVLLILQENILIQMEQYIPIMHIGHGFIYWIIIVKMIMFIFLIGLVNKMEIK